MGALPKPNGELLAGGAATFEGAPKENPVDVGATAGVEVDGAPKKDGEEAEEGAGAEGVDELPKLKGEFAAGFGAAPNPVVAGCPNGEPVAGGAVADWPNIDGVAEADPNEFVVGAGAPNIAGAAAGGFGAPNEKEETGVEVVGGVASGGFGEGFPKENGAATAGGRLAGAEDAEGVGRGAGVVVVEVGGFPNIEGGFGAVDAAPKSGVVVPDVLAPSPPKNPLDPAAAGAVAVLPNIVDEVVESAFGATTLAAVLFAPPKKSGMLRVDVIGADDSLGAAGAPNENPPAGLTAEASTGLADGAEKGLAIGAGAGAGVGRGATEGAEPKLNDGLTSTLASEIGAAGFAGKSDGVAVGGAVNVATGRSGGAATAGAWKCKSEIHISRREGMNSPRRVYRQTFPHRQRAAAESSSPQPSPRLSRPQLLHPNVRSLVVSSFAQLSPSLHPPQSIALAGCSSWAWRGRRAIGIDHSGEERTAIAGEERRWTGGVSRRYRKLVEEYSFRQCSKLLAFSASVRNLLSIRSVRRG